MTRSICLSSPRVVLVLIVLLCAAASMPAIAQMDLSVVAITAPANGCALAATENVTVRIFNYGSSLPPSTSFILTYTINAGGPITEVVTLPSTFLSNGSLAYTFTTQANLFSSGSYIFAATVSLAGDINPGNDAYNGYTVVNSAPSVGGAISLPPAASSGTLTLTGNTGVVQQWEESDDGGQRWFALSNATTTQAFANLRAAAIFRARVVNGSCAEAVSSTAVVTP